MSIDIEAIVLSMGGHTSHEEGHCLLEVVSMFAGLPFSAEPDCVDQVLRVFGISWNDGMRSDEERAQLKRYITRLVGTNHGAVLSKKRGWMAMDWLIRVNIPVWFTLVPALVPYAEALKSLPLLSCEQDLLTAVPAIKNAKDAANEALNATRVAALDATDEFAWNYIIDAANVATRVAAGVTAGNSAVDAILSSKVATRVTALAGKDCVLVGWEASLIATLIPVTTARITTLDAAKAILEPTVLALQQSAHELFSRMIDAAL